jgi:hypothetical protein
MRSTPAGLAVSEMRRSVLARLPHRCFEQRELLPAESAVFAFAIAVAA